MLYFTISGGLSENIEYDITCICIHLQIINNECVGQYLLYHPWLVYHTTPHRTLETSQPFNTTPTPAVFNMLTSFFLPNASPAMVRETFCAKHLHMLRSRCQKTSPRMEIGLEWWTLYGLLKLPLLRPTPLCAWMSRQKRMRRKGANPSVTSDD